MAPNVRIGSLFGTKRFGAFNLLHLVLVAILYYWGWEQGQKSPPPSLCPSGPQPSEELHYPEISSAVSLLELDSSSSCKALPFPTSMAKAASLGIADLRELLGT